MGEITGGFATALGLLAMVHFIGGAVCHHRLQMKCRYKSLFFLTLGWALTGPAIADPAIQIPARQALETKWYAQVEQDMKSQYETQRAKWQTEISSRGATWTEAHERRLRMIAYNRAAFLAICTARILEADGPTGIRSQFPTCMKPFTDELDRYFEKTKLLTASNKDHFENCAKAAIDTVREGYLRPYGFLSEATSKPRLYEFGKLNACLDAGL
jgi:hypothetical protein